MKNIAVLIKSKERHSEGLRISAGLSLLGDKVDIFLLNEDFDINDIPVIKNHLEMIKAVGIGLYSNFKKEDFNFISDLDIGKKMLKYDIVFFY